MKTERQLIREMFGGPLSRNNRWDAACIHLHRMTIQWRRCVCGDVVLPWEYCVTCEPDKGWFPIDTQKAHP